MSVLESIRGKLQTRRQSRELGFHEMVARIAAGKPVDEAAIETMLESCGKSLEDLEAAVKIAEERIALAKQVAAGAGLDNEYGTVTAKIEAEDKKLQSARQVHAKAVMPLQGRLAEIREMQTKASDARAKLIQTCSDAAILAEMDDVTAALNDASESVKQFRSAIRSDPGQSDDGRGEREHSLANTAREKLADAERELAELGVRRNEIEQRMAMP